MQVGLGAVGGDCPAVTVQVCLGDGSSGCPPARRYVSVSVPAGQSVCTDVCRQCIAGQCGAVLSVPASMVAPQGDDQLAVRYYKKPWSVTPDGRAAELAAATARAAV